MRTKIMAGLIQARFRLHIYIYQDAWLHGQHERACVCMYDNISDYNDIKISWLGISTPVL